MGTQINKLLIVEDDLQQQSRLTNGLGEYPEIGDIHVCDNLQQAKQSLCEWQPDVILLDVGLPDGNGCLLYTSPSPRDLSTSRMPSSA